MTQQSMRETTAEVLFDQVWDELGSQGAASKASAGLNHDRFRWLLPELVHLLDHSGDLATGPLDVIVRIRVVDCLFIENGGDPLLSPASEVVVDQLVTALTETLVRLQHQTMAEGQCTPATTSTPMFG